MVSRLFFDGIRVRGGEMLTALLSVSILLAALIVVFHVKLSVVHI